MSTPGEWNDTFQRSLSNSRVMYCDVDIFFAVAATVPLLLIALRAGESRIVNALTESRIPLT